MTEAYSPSVWALRNRPPLTPTIPPGAAKALSCGLLIRMNSRRRSLTSAGFHQPVDAGFDVILELRVVELRDLATQQGQPGAT